VIFLPGSTPPGNSTSLSPEVASAPLSTHVAGGDDPIPFAGWTCDPGLANQSIVECPVTHHEETVCLRAKPGQLGKQLRDGDAKPSSSSTTQAIWITLASDICHISQQVPSIPGPGGVDFCHKHKIHDESLGHPCPLSALCGTWHHPV
jgi:hypothetical protein